jgi:phage regulator Rha-like protein
MRSQFVTAYPGKVFILKSSIVIKSILPVKFEIMTEINLIQQKIHEIRGEMVMLDFDLAFLYEVDTKTLNQAVKRNIERFPADFMFRLTEKEWDEMMSQTVISSSINRRKDATPFAFTEHGVAMISGVLKSEKAVKMNISIIRMFIEMKRVLIKNASIKGQLQEMRERIGEHDVQLNKIYDTIEHLLDLTMNRVKWNERNIIGFKEDKNPKR